MHNLVKLKLPRFLLVIDETSACILWDVDGDMLYKTNIRLESS